MSDLFERIYPHVLKVEGKYSDDPVDPGGPTKWGISWNNNIEALKKLGVRRSTMQFLTKEQAVEIYRQKYWLGSHANTVTDEGLAYIHFDCAVNCGPETARHILSMLSVNPRYYDGTGDKNEALFLRLVFEYEMLRLNYYTHTRKELKREYLEGWVNRMVYVGKIAMAMV